MKDPSSFNKESCINEISRINSEVNLSGFDLVCLLIYFFSKFFLFAWFNSHFFIYSAKYR
jgi:hypothetical protein